MSYPSESVPAGTRLHDEEDSQFAHSFLSASCGMIVSGFVSLMSADQEKGRENGADTLWVAA